MILPKKAMYLKMKQQHNHRSCKVGFNSYCVMGHHWENVKYNILMCLITNLSEDTVVPHWTQFICTAGN